MTTMPHLSRLFSGLIRLLLAAALAAGLPALAGTAVGQVTLAIGVSQVQRDGKALPLAKGDSVEVGDRIATSESGQIFLRFQDGALLSLRPNSVLKVQAYDYNPANPQASQVKFELENGVARAISGEAAQSAKDRFRLNTPLVAIGVRGTDFTTLAAPGRTVVLVNQGAIVLAPFGAECSAAGSGPCGGAAARELSASMAGMALVYRANMAAPSLQPLNTLRGSDAITPIVQLERSNAVLARASVADSHAPASIGALLPAQPGLVWGRWNIDPLPGDALTQGFMQAMAGNQVTVGDGYFFLFRNENQPNLIGGTRGSADFALQGGSAYYRAPGNIISAASIDGGNLSINFSNNSFSTSLRLNSAGSGPSTFSSSGTINPGTGIFLGSSANPHVAGALSFNTMQAGYSFNQVLTGGGSLNGATLWGR